VLVQSVQTTVYTKPTHLRVLLHYNSAHSARTKQNVILAQLIRIFRLNTNLTLAGKQMRMFILLMRKLRALPARTARKIWLRFRSWLAKLLQPVTTAKPKRQKTTTLWLGNNTYLKPFKLAVREFQTLLTETERQRLGELQVQAKAAVNFGRTLYRP
jgi:hypothetical protein